MIITALLFVAILCSLVEHTVKSFSILTARSGHPAEAIKEAKLEAVRMNAIKFIPVFLIYVATGVSSATLTAQLITLTILVIDRRHITSTHEVIIGNTFRTILLITLTILLIGSAAISAMGIPSLMDDTIALIIVSSLALSLVCDTISPLTAPTAIVERIIMSVVASSMIATFFITAVTLDALNILFAAGSVMLAILSMVFLYLNLGGTKLTLQSTRAPIIVSRYLMLAGLLYGTISSL